MRRAATPPLRGFGHRDLGQKEGYDNRDAAIEPPGTAYNLSFLQVVDLNGDVFDVESLKYLAHSPQQHNMQSDRCVRLRQDFPFIRLRVHAASRHCCYQACVILACWKNHTDLD